MKKVRLKLEIGVRPFYIIELSGVQDDSAVFYQGIHCLLRQKQNEI